MLTQREDTLLTLGARPMRDGSGTHFRVWAPRRGPRERRVHVVAYTPKGTKELYELRDVGDGHFDGFIETLRPGDHYKYRLDEDPEKEFPDPASRYQPHGVHGPSEIVEYRDFIWTEPAKKPASMEEDLILYEVHVGTATEAGTFHGLVERLGHVKDLGATAILLMPVAEFPGERSWGYNGVNLFAPARAYGGPHGLRMLVNSAHSAGLHVILDTVFGHVGPEGNYLNEFATYFSRRMGQHGSPVFNLGDAISDNVIEFLVENCCYWAQEFHIDGLRLDAMHVFEYDEQPHAIARLVRLARYNLKEKAGRSLLFIAEHDRCDPNLLKPPYDLSTVDALYADDFHHQAHVLLSMQVNGYYADYKADPAGGLLETLNRSIWFDGQRESPYRLKKAQRETILEPASRGGRGSRRVTDSLPHPPVGGSTHDIPRKRFVWCLQNHDQVGNRPLGDRLSSFSRADAYRAVTALLLLTPHTPLLFMGQEWGSSTPFRYFTDFKYDKAIEGGQKGRLRELQRLEFRDASKMMDPQDPQTFQQSKLLWRERFENSSRQLLKFHKDLIRLRREKSVVRTPGRNHFKATVIDDAFVLEWSDGERPRLIAVTRLHGAGTVRLPARYLDLWLGRVEEVTILLDTEHVEYGGVGDTGLSDSGEISMPSPRFILFDPEVRPPQPPKRRVFISYSARQEGEARKLAEILEAIGHEVFYFGDLKTGEEWRTKILAALEASDDVYVLISKESIVSHWVTFELAIALYIRALRGRDPAAPTGQVRLLRVDFPADDMPKGIADQQITAERFDKHLDDLLKLKDADGR